MIDRFFNNRFFTLYIFPFLIGSLSVLSFQPFNFTIVNFFILPMFFYLVVLIKKRSKSVYRKKPYKKNLFILGTSFGFGFYLCGLYWITNSLTFDESFRILIPFGLILIPLFLSLFFSLSVLIAGPFLNFNVISIIFFSGILALFDYFRAKILTGFPWNLWVYSLSSMTEIIQILNVIGLFAFNLISITVFMLPASFLFKTSFIKKCINFIYILIISFLLYIFGNYTINQNQQKILKENDKFNIKVISPNFKLKYNMGLNEIEERLEKLIKYSNPNKDLKTLFIWPEGVFAGYNYSDFFNFKNLINKNFSEKHYILLGINRLNEQNNGTYNGLIIINNQMKVIQEYKKQKLVPFGEFLPFEKMFSKIGFKKITEGYGSFLKGGEQENLKIDKLNILPLICYEIIFTKLIQKSNENTNLIINISEDGWFGNSIGPHQHFAKGIYRAIEQNSFLIRSANKGISAIVNNKGAILKQLNSNETGNIELEVPLIKSENKNKNDLIFFALLITYIFTFIYYNKKI